MPRESSLVILLADLVASRADGWTSSRTQYLGTYRTFHPTALGHSGLCQSRQTSSFVQYRYPARTDISCTKSTILTQRSIAGFPSSKPSTAVRRLHRLSVVTILNPADYQVEMVVAAGGFDSSGQVKLFRCPLPETKRHLEDVPVANGH